MQAVQDSFWVLFSEARRGLRTGGRRAQEATQSLPAPAQEERVQGVRGDEHLPAPAQEKPMQGVWADEHLPAPAQKKLLQGVRAGGQSTWEGSCVVVDGPERERERERERFDLQISTKSDLELIYL